ncbi:MAG: hypothetical protein HY906_05260 [Deltaproteobacteria bacterium]|nr:hypothetical protein [Deltaproteobacteria bacterium]
MMRFYTTTAPRGDRREAPRVDGGSGVDFAGGQVATASWRRLHYKLVPPVPDRSGGSTTGGLMCSPEGMSNRRKVQVRRERKRRRRDERRKRRRGALPARSGASLVGEEWAQSMILTSDGRPPDPDQVAALAALGTMSDALLRLMEPYVSWPPHPSEIEELATWLQLGADVWNATVVAATGEQLQEQLSVIVSERELPDVEDPVALVAAIACPASITFSTRRQLHLPSPLLR